MSRPVLCASFVLIAFAALAAKDSYLDLVSRAVGAYDDRRLAEYEARVAREGVSEHGFPRLAANLAFLVAHGRETARRDQCGRLLDLCAQEVPRAFERNGRRAGNDFSVKELALAIRELEASGAFPKARTEAWRRAFAPMAAERIYSAQPRPGDGRANNWCVYGAASEQARLFTGMGGSAAYVERYVSDQLRFFDSNGMYRDPGQPMVYDLVTRLQFAAALWCGYDGPSRPALEALLRKSAEPTLRMQAVTGEIPFGGRSNQFLHNETFYAALCEWYAARFARAGDLRTAGRFKAAARRAVAALGGWLGQKPVSHVKNRYPVDSGIGCEGYAYFDKYMVTMGSWACLAYLFADDSIPAAEDGPGDSCLVMGEDFHRIVLNRGDYTAQFDWKAQDGYDASGLGRLVRRGAPSALCLACSAAKKPHYRLSSPNPRELAIAPGWARYAVVTADVDAVVLTDGRSRWTSRLAGDGLRMTLAGEGPQTLTLPAIVTDGEAEGTATPTADGLEVAFRGAVLRYRSSAPIRRTDDVCGNRNGRYRIYETTAPDRLEVRIEIDGGRRPAR